MGWAHGVVGQLEEKLGDAGFKGWFCEQVEAWTVEVTTKRLAVEKNKKTGKEEEVERFPGNAMLLPLKPTIRQSIPEQCAILAAIRDTQIPGEKLLPREVVMGDGSSPDWSLLQQIAWEQLCRDAEAVAAESDPDKIAGYGIALGSMLRACVAACDAVSGAVVNNSQVDGPPPTFDNATQDEDRDYVLVSIIKKEYFPLGVVPNHRKLKRFLGKHEEIRTKHPAKKGGGERKNRLLVHLGDWHKATQALKEWWLADDLPEMERGHNTSGDDQEISVEEMSSRYEAARNKKMAKGWE